MNLEQGIKDVIQESMKSGLVEKIVKEQLEVSINKAVGNLFGHYGDATKMIEDKIKSVMMPQLEIYDYSEHIVKMDDVLTEIMKTTTIENTTILKNFSDYMTDDIGDTIEISKMFEKYCKFISEEVDTSELEVCFDDGPSYESVEVSFQADENEERSWSSFRHAVLSFECEKKNDYGEDMNFEIQISKYKADDYWTIKFCKSQADIRSLKHLNSFEIFLMKLDQNRVKVTMDEWNDEDCVTPVAEPEASFS